MAFARDRSTLFSRRDRSAAVDRPVELRVEVFLTSCGLAGVPLLYLVQQHSQLVELMAGDAFRRTLGCRGRHETEQAIAVEDVVCGDGRDEGTASGVG